MLHSCRDLVDEITQGLLLLGSAGPQVTPADDADGSRAQGLGLERRAECLRWCGEIRRRWEPLAPLAAATHGGASTASLTSSLAAEPWGEAHSSKVHALLSTLEGAAALLAPPQSAAATAPAAAPTATAAAAAPSTVTTAAADDAVARTAAVSASAAQLSSRLAAVRVWLAELADLLAHGVKGRFVWVDGPLVHAMEQGHWLLLDNANFCNPSVLDRLNPLLERGGELELP